MDHSRPLYNTQMSIDRGPSPPPRDMEKSAHNFPPTPESTPEASEISYPEGSQEAWLVVLGAWCGLAASIGIYNSTGVFEVVVSETLLPELDSSTLGWVFSVYAFVNWVSGAQVGPTFDAMGPHGLLIAGTVCTLGGIFLLSICTGEIGLLRGVKYLG